MFSQLREMGLSCIPIYKEKKNPVLNGWQVYCERLPTAEEAEEWEQKYKGFNVGVALGPASNLLCVDIDTDDETVLSTCPPSPIRRRGQKGEARFFKFNPKIENRKIGKVDILSTGRQVLIPPSIHPITLKPYTWVSIDNLQNFDVNDLPELTPEDLMKIERIFSGDITPSGKINLSGTFTNQDPTRESPTGSQDRLKTLATSLIHQGKPLDEAVKELLKYDHEHHKPKGYFYEKGRHSDSRADPFTNAARFYVNVMSSINSAREKQNEAPLLPSKPLVVELKPKDLNINLGFNFKPYPRARGMMAYFQKACELYSKANQDALSLGGALAMIAGITSNRFASKVGPIDITPNIYILNLAYSGAGKEVSQSLMSEMLMDTNLVGAASYRSGSSIVESLPKQQERVDIIDEASTFLKMVTSKEIYQREVGEILCSLFSKAGTRYEGITSVTNGKKKGACWNPHITILASTTPAGFKEAVRNEMEAKGFMPRFLTFFQKDMGDFKRRTKADAEALDSLKDILRASVDAITSIKKRKHPNFKPSKNLLAEAKNDDLEDIGEGIRYQADLIPFTEEAEKAFYDYTELCFKKQKKDPEHFESAFYARFAELAAKIALLDAISQDKREIDLDSFEWAKEVVEVQWHNSKLFYELASGANETEARFLRVKSIIQKAGRISQNELTRKTQWLQRRERQEIIDSLIETRVIELAKTESSEKGGPVTHFYQFILT